MLTCVVFHGRDWRYRAQLVCVTSFYSCVVFVSFVSFAIGSDPPNRFTYAILVDDDRKEKDVTYVTFPLSALAAYLLLANTPE